MYHYLLSNAELPINFLYLCLYEWGPSHSSPFEMEGDEGGYPKMFEGRNSFDNSGPHAKFQVQMRATLKLSPALVLYPNS